MYWETHCSNYSTCSTQSKDHNKISSRICLSKGVVSHQAQAEREQWQKYQFPVLRRNDLAFVVATRKNCRPRSGCRWEGQSRRNHKLFRSLVELFLCNSTRYIKSQISPPKTTKIICAAMQYKPGSLFAHERLLACNYTQVTNDCQVLATAKGTGAHKPVLVIYTVP